jgi:hypothetical protein
LKESTVYTALKTTKFYGRSGYEALAKKAAANGVVITWTQLRVISERLADNKEVRTEIERELVQRKMTEMQLKALIDEKAPETIKTRANQKSNQSALSLIDGLNIGLTKLLRSKDSVLRSLDDVESQYNGDISQSEEIVKVCGKTIVLLSDLTIAFGEYHDALDRLVNAANQIVNGQNKEKEKRELAEKAHKIRQQLSAEKAKAAEKERIRQDRVQLMGEFADEVEQSPPKRSAKPAILDHLPDADDSQQNKVREKRAAPAVIDSDADYYDEEDQDEPDDAYDDEDDNEDDNEDAEYNEDDEYEGVEGESGINDEFEYNEDEVDDEDEDEDDNWEDEDYEVDEREVNDIFDENGNIP